MRGSKKDRADRSINLLGDLEEINHINLEGFPKHPRNKGLQDHQDRNRKQVEETIDEFQGSPQDLRELPPHPTA